MKQKVLIYFLSVLSFFSLALNVFLLTNKSDNQINSETHLVTKVFDGDSFLLENTTNIRLWGINAPEIGFCGASEAKNYLSSLILNEQVKIGESFQKHGRTFALIYLNNTLINAQMLKAGWGTADSIPAPEKQAMQQARQFGRQNNLGIFSTLCSQLTNPLNPKCNIKGNIDKETSTKVYHLPECREYNSTIVDLFVGEKWFCTEAEAINAGFTKALHCPN
jgi:endonuclease YncB( thermonuclease family)